MDVASGRWKDADIANVTAPVAHPLDVELDRRGGITRAQEVGVQGVDVALRVDGAPGRDERLRGHLPAEDPGVADRVGDPDKHVAGTALEVQELEQGVDRVVGHPRIVSGIRHWWAG
jgi:hypothetical protein